MVACTHAGNLTDPPAQALPSNYLNLTIYCSYNYIYRNYRRFLGKRLFHTPTYYLLDGTVQGSIRLSCLSRHPGRLSTRKPENTTKGGY